MTQRAPGVWIVAGLAAWHVCYPAHAFPLIAEVDDDAARRGAFRLAPVEVVPWQTERVDVLTGEVAEPPLWVRQLGTRVVVVDGDDRRRRRSVVVPAQLNLTTDLYFCAARTLDDWAALHDDAQRRAERHHLAAQRDLYARCAAHIGAVYEAMRERAMKREAFAHSFDVAGEVEL